MSDRVDWYLSELPAPLNGILQRLRDRVARGVERLRQGDVDAPPMPYASK